MMVTMMSGNEVDHHKIPIWIGTDCKLVSGITKSTTCHNVIQTLLRNENPAKYVIVEKWKKMERRLDGSVKILKVWKAWGDQKDDVALILRQHHSNDGYIDKKISTKVLRRNKGSSQHHKFPSHGENMDEVQVPEPMERLLKLVLTQGETIQVQLKKLRHQEEQIERYEEQMHKMRSLQEGENYVVESYLRDDKGKKSKKRDKSPRKQGWLKHQQQLVGQNPTNHQNPHHQNLNANNPPPTHLLQDPHLLSPTNVSGCNQSKSAKTSSQQEYPETPATGPDSLHHDSTLSAIPVGRSSGRGSSSKPEIEDQEDPTEDTAALQEESELMERICDLNSKLTKEEEHLVKLGLKIKKFHEKHKEEPANPDDGGDDDPSSDPRQESSSSSRTKSNQMDGNVNPSNPPQNSLREEEDEELRRLHHQLAALRDLTEEQSEEIELNEKSLNELEKILDGKHDQLAHLTYQIQLVDQESDLLRQRLFNLSQTQSSAPPQSAPANTFSNHQQSTPFLSNPPNTSSIMYSPCPPQSTHGPAAHHDPADAPGILPTNPLPPHHSLNPHQPPPPPHHHQTFTPNHNHLPVSTPHPERYALDISHQHSISKHPGGEIQNFLQPTSDPTFLPNPATVINFSSPQPETIPITTAQLSLHIKPCRDTQDNDSNSDTGISSLHSSSDENTLFVLDTLV